ncbi:MAG: Transcriptional regulator, AcrR family, partial [uncultured Rubrobacteraceae bacterium]
GRGDEQEETCDAKEAGGGASLGGGLRPLLPGGHKGRRGGYRLRKGGGLQEDALQPIRGQGRVGRRILTPPRRGMEGLPARGDRGGVRAQGEATGRLRGVRGLVGGGGFQGLRVRQRRGRDPRHGPPGPRGRPAAQGGGRGAPGRPGGRGRVRRAPDPRAAAAPFARGRRRDGGDAPQPRAPRRGEIPRAGAAGRPATL